MEPKEKRYDAVYEKAKPVLSDTADLISAMASVAALLKEEFPELLWAGFYRLVGDELIVGPYQGSLGCLSIEVGRGVCGKAAADKKTVIVPDVHRFQGHIACDPRSNSEIVVPVFDIYGELTAVLDLDSADCGRFDPADAKCLERLVKLLADKKIFA